MRNHERHGPSWHWFDREHLSETESYPAGLEHGPSIRLRRSRPQSSPGMRHAAGGVLPASRQAEIVVRNVVRQLSLVVL